MKHKLWLCASLDDKEWLRSGLVIIRQPSCIIAHLKLSELNSNFDFVHFGINMHNLEVAF